MNSQNPFSSIVKYFVIFLVLIGFAGTSMLAGTAFAEEEEEIMIFVENDARKVYYTGENIQSAFYDHESRSVIFETGMNAKLEIQAPQIYKKGPGLFILKNGEEIAGITRADDCFYYVDIKTKVPEKIEIIFAFWPEYPETKEGCETFTVSPLKQFRSGIVIDEIQCKESLILVTRHDGSPACVKPETKEKLMQKGWAIDPMFYGLTKSQITYIQLAKFGCKKLGNQTYCDTMVQEKIEYYLQQNKLNAKLEPEPERETMHEKNLIDANNKLREIYQINPSLGPFHFQDVIVGHGIGDGYLIVDVLEKFYHSVDDRELIIQKIVDITNEKVDIDFSPSDGITPKDTESTFQYVWNNYLHKNHIQFSPQEGSYVNTDEGYHYEKDNKVCSPLISSSGTEFYISSMFTDEPFKITGTFIDEMKPIDCQKIWKTDSVLPESDRILGVWLNDFFNDSRNTVLFTDYSITEIDTRYSLDEPVTFEFTETCFGDPCIPIEIVYYQDRVWMENIVLVDKIIRDCPAGKGNEFLSSTFDTSKDSEFGKKGDWINFSIAGEYFVEITNENQPDGKIVASFEVV